MENFNFKPMNPDGQFNINFNENENSIPLKEQEAESFEKERQEVARKYKIMDSSKLKKGDGPSGWDYDFYGDVALYAEAMDVVDTNDIYKQYDKKNKNTSQKTIIPPFDLLK